MRSSPGILLAALLLACLLLGCAGQVVAQELESIAGQVLSRTSVLVFFGVMALLLLLLALTDRYWRAQADAERLRTMFDMAPLSMVVLDEQNCILRWNRQAERTFQWPVGEMIGNSLVATVIPEDDRSKVVRILNGVRSGRTISYYENHCLRKDGSSVLCEWMTAPFVDRRNKRGYLITMARDITEQRRLEQQLEQAAHYDGLTGLPNRTLILELLKQSIAIARRQRYQLAVLFLDLDDFKSVNDQFGHKAGDRFLRQVAERLQSSIRQGDHAGRLAGDEFLIILQNVTGRQRAGTVVEKLRQRLIEPCVLDDGVEVAIKGSFGISMYPEDSDDLEALIHQADRAMYREKQQHRVD